MHIEALVVGRLEANCYIRVCPATSEAIVVDPGGDADEIIKRIADNGWQVKYIINTHGHLDHTADNAAVRAATGAPVMMHAADVPRRSAPGRGAPDKALTDGDSVNWGELSLSVIHTPGHTPGGICLLTGDKLFAGDTLFAGSVGRSDFPGGSHRDLINSIKTKLLVLPDDTEVYPGHGPRTTIGDEKRYNPFLR
jgi:hydroxyacylglutathione hydrolase